MRHNNSIDERRDDEANTEIEWKITDQKIGMIGEKCVIKNMR